MLGYGDVKILFNKLKIQSLLEINGYQVHLSGKTGDRLILRNAMNLCVPEKWTAYIKKLEKLVVRNVKEQAITSEANIELYDLLTDKHLNAVYAKRPNAYGQKLVDDRSNFVNLKTESQCEAILQILQLTKIGNNETNLKLIGESEHSGKMRISKNLKDTDKPAIICQSVTGLYERKIYIFGDKLDK